jgi:hypothetical protein
VLDEPDLKIEGAAGVITQNTAKLFYGSKNTDYLTHDRAVAFSKDTAAPVIGFDGSQQDKIWTNLPDPVTVYITEPNFRTKAAGGTDETGLFFSLDNRPYRRIEFDPDPAPDANNVRAYQVARADLLAAIGGQTGWDDKTLFPDGSYNIMFRAIDLGSSGGEGIFAFTKDTTGPEISFSNILTEYTSPSAITDTISPEIRGRINDPWSAVSVDPAGPWPAYRLYRLPLTGTAAAADEITGGWTAFPSLDAGGGTVAEWAVPLGVNFPDGFYKLEVRAKDASGNETTLLNNGKPPAQDICFRLDRSSPELRPYTLASTEPEYRPDGSAVIVRTIPAGTVFSDVPGAADDAVVFTMYGEITDPNLRQLAVRIDDDPEKAIEIPGVLGSDIDWAFDGTNYVYEPVSGKGFKIILSQEETPLINLGGSYGDKKGYIRRIKWEYRVSKADYKLLASDAQYPVLVSAEDFGGRRGSYTWNFHKDATAPEIEFTSLEASANTLLSSGNPEISVQIRDPNTIRRAMARIEVWDYLAANRPGTIPSDGKENGADPKEPGWWKPMNAPYDADFSLFAAGDEDALHDKDPHKAQSSETLKKVLEAANFPEGKYRIRVSAQDYSVNRLEAARQGNPAVSPWKVFYVDPQTPRWTRSTGGIYIRARVI